MKKVLSLFMSLVMLASVTAGTDLSVYAQAKDTEPDFSYTYVNPYYEGKIDESVFSEDEEEDSDAFSYTAPKLYATAYSEAKAIEVLRDKMVARTKTVTLNVVTQRAGNDALKYIANEALSQEHSVSSTDGDYLLFNMYGMQGYGIVISMGSKNEYQLTFEMEYLTTAAQEKEVTARINSTLKELNLSGKSDYRKIRLIHNFVCENAKYDYEHMDDITYKMQFSTYGALIKGVTVCQGYATLFYRLCMESGISCRVIAGGDHAWNIAKLGNKYYYVDTTWDDTVTDYYPDKVNGTYYSDDYVFDWFMLGSKDFLYHTFESDYTTNYFKNKYPVSASSYVCTHPSKQWMLPEDADCTKGYYEGLICTECDEVFETRYFSPVAEHSYVKKVVAPTCTAKGYTRYACAVCNSKYDVDVKNALGHSYTKTTTKATTSANGKIVESCTRCKTVKSNTTLYKISNIDLSTTYYNYDGKSHTPAVTVKDSSGKALVRDKDYTLSYTGGRTAVGKYQVKVTFKGNYSGSTTKYFYIRPKSTAISSVKASSNGFTVQWNKQTSNTNGY